MFCYNILCYSMLILCRVNYATGEGVVRSFRRGCDPYTGQTDNCVEDTFFITCNTYCNTPYCNDVDGSMPQSRKKVAPAKAPQLRTKEGILRI